MSTADDILALLRLLDNRWKKLEQLIEPFPFEKTKYLTVQHHEASLYNTD